jgi:DNA-binding NtrC family response regulator
MPEHAILEWIHLNPHLAVRPLEELEREAILQAMILCRGDISLSVERLGISRAKLYRKLKKYRERSDA